ncbi:hypothetical protein D3C86_1656050 [compost metagenome]
MPGAIVSAGSVIVLPACTVTAVPLLAPVGAVAVKAVVLLDPPALAPMLATLPAMLFAPQALAICSVAVFGVLV